MSKKHSDKQYSDKQQQIDIGVSLKHFQAMEVSTSSLVHLLRTHESRFMRKKQSPKDVSILCDMLLNFRKTLEVLLRCVDDALDTLPVEERTVINGRVKIIYTNSSYDKE